MTTRKLFALLLLSLAVACQGGDKATDTPDRLRPAQMERIARMTTRVVVELAQLGYDAR